MERVVVVWNGRMEPSTLVDKLTALLLGEHKVKALTVVVLLLFVILDSFSDHTYLR